MSTQKKIDTVTELTDKVAKAKSIILADYRGLKHKQLEDLRKLLKKTDAQFVVTKNTLLRKALGGKAAKLETKLSDATATLFSFADEIAPLKELITFFKNAGAGVPKAGLLGDTLLEAADIERLSTLPTRPVLLAQLAAQLNAPIQGLHYALKWNINRLVWALKEVSVHGKTK